MLAVAGDRIDLQVPQQLLEGGRIAAGSVVQVQDADGVGGGVFPARRARLAGLEDPPLQCFSLAAQVDAVEPGLERWPQPGVLLLPGSFPGGIVHGVEDRPQQRDVAACQAGPGGASLLQEPVQVGGVHQAAAGGREAGVAAAYRISVPVDCGGCRLPAPDRQLAAGIGMPAQQCRGQRTFQQIAVRVVWRCVGHRD